MMLNFMEIKSNNPKMTQDQICKQLGTFYSTIKRYRDHIQMDSPYNRNKNKKKSKESDSAATQSQSQTTNENTKNNKKNKESDLKCGNPINEQTFQNDKTNSISENKQEDNTKLITIARRLVDNN